jgi:glycosyltransferase involved in cell wall biosynthesis
LKPLVFAYPGDLQTITGGYIYDRRLLPELEALGWSVMPLSLGDAFPMANEQAISAAAVRLAEIETGTPIIVDGLALGIDPRLAKRAAGRGPLIALVHHPLALESGLAEASARHLAQTEKEALIHAHRIVVTSEPTGATLIADYGVLQERLSIAKPGTEKASFARGSGGPDVVLLAVAAISPRKGFDILVEALAQLTDLPWRLDLVGNEAIDPQTSAALRRQIRDCGLEGRIRQWGAMDHLALEARYDAADIFVLASLYEGYGMVYAEAIAHGLPVIGTTGGAIPSVVPPEAGILARPGDVESLAEALWLMIADEVLRSRYAAGAREAAGDLPSWQDAAAIMANAVEAAIRDWRAS